MAPHTPGPRPRDPPRRPAAAEPQPPQAGPPARSHRRRPVLPLLVWTSGAVPPGTTGPLQEQSRAVTAALSAGDTATVTALVHPARPHRRHHPAPEDAAQTLAEAYIEPTTTEPAYGPGESFPVRAARTEQLHTRPDPLPWLGQHRWQATLTDWTLGCREDQAALVVEPAAELATGRAANP